ncbi:hypothetical protein EJ02DRAFT_93954 [Clathrospora elynae]|uniref:Uncharacterized protein n=1 Tax=Clathrospora elynae TaxID=706981 RepID=A0A6A5SYL9_9PLEO|nr:hypothetical protein EJ02DRAFT_93954 [Clathrospora elynae]
MQSYCVYKNRENGIEMGKSAGSVVPVGSVVTSEGAHCWSKSDQYRVMFLILVIVGPCTPDCTSQHGRNRQMSCFSSLPVTRGVLVFVCLCFGCPEGLDTSRSILRRSSWTARDDQFPSSTSSSRSGLHSDIGACGHPSAQLFCLHPRYVKARIEASSRRDEGDVIALCSPWEGASLDRPGPR